ncbi:OadG family transporter subunit [Coraliomargarita sp. SDUM461003]|uniref:OadG family transporter subunit n=1 Tax=Thalassobacterium maritimum TaxID=3041265 RepID=A0ABU1AUN6_9BACT|nr:OadG family transporter subunit [Coraliomargarita sp. SDUM461003]MDQ8207798.1 OadG family transporter subunit [Coraliomargarita sp. SDUM461003]
MFALYSTLAQVSAAAPVESPSTVSVVVVGFLFVMIVLALLAAVTSCIGAFFIKQAARDAAKAAQAAEKAAASKPAAAATPAASAAASSAPAVDEEAEDPAILAVIAAAVHSVMGDRAHRVVSVRSTGPGWAQEGRRQIFSSHRVR